MTVGPVKLPLSMLQGLAGGKRGWEGREERRGAGSGEEGGEGARLDGFAPISPKGRHGNLKAGHHRLAALHAEPLRIHGFVRNKEPVVVNGA